MKLAKHCYIDNEELRAFKVGLFLGRFKDVHDKIWTVTIMPNELKEMHTYKSAMDLFKKLKLHRFFQMPICCIDYKRVYQLLTTMDEDGNAVVED